MKKLLVILNVIFLLTAGFVLTTGCQGGASCKETCDENDDCGPDLGCFNTNDGKICLPTGCEACFDDGRTCNYSENTDEQEKGEEAECDFTECTY